VSSIRIHPPTTMTHEQFLTAREDTPSGWELGVKKRFIKKSEADKFLKESTQEWATSKSQLEGKIVKRGGSVDPHYLMVIRHTPSQS